MLELRALEPEDMAPIVRWRNDDMETLRTPHLTTMAQQMAWYDREIAHPSESRTRYWALWDMVLADRWGSFVGYGGIEHIEWENRRGEISLLISPEHRGKGYGREAVGLFLRQAFQHLNLEHVWGEVYTCGHVAFWERMVESYQGFKVMLPAHKSWNGRYYVALYFDFSRAGYMMEGPGTREEANGHA